MLLEDVFHRVEAGLENLGRRLFKPDPHARLRDEVAELTDKLRDLHDSLRAARKKLSEAQRRLEDNQQTVVLLQSRVELALRGGEGPHAWHLALEVDKLRQEIAQDRGRLPRYEQLVWSIEFKIRQQVRELAKAQEQLYGLPSERI